MQVETKNAVAQTGSELDWFGELPANWPRFENEVLCCERYRESQ